MASGKAPSAGSERFAGLILKGIKETGEEFGVGAYGRVFAVDYYGTVCAAKEVHSILISGVGVEEFQRTRDNFLRECQQCAELRHPNIVQFLGVYYKPGSPIPILVMEKMDESLRSSLERYPKIPMTIKLSILFDVSLGLRYLHSHKIVHRDLSSNNVLLSTLLRAKISDLGVAKVVRSDSKKSLTKIPGTADFMPPEAQLDMPIYDTSLDVFSYGGVVLHTATQLWPTPSAMKQYDPKTRKVRGFTEVERRQSYIDELRGNAKELVPIAVQCLDDDPEVRPSMINVSERVKRLKDRSPDVNINPMSLLQQKNQLRSEVDQQKMIIDQQKKETNQQKTESNQQKRVYDQQKREIDQQKRVNNQQKLEIDQQKREINQQKKEIDRQKREIDQLQKHIHGQQPATQSQLKLPVKAKKLVGWLSKKSNPDPTLTAEDGFWNTRTDTRTGSGTPGLVQAIDSQFERLKEPIPLKNFSEHVTNMHRDRDYGFEEEYSTIRTDQLASNEASELPANIIKNRYANVLPYDFSRVKISQVDLKDDDTDYINATYIDGYNRTNAYIAAQGPLPETVKDFWQMVWDHKVSIIVMLTKVIEADVQKCEQYWPDRVGEIMQPKPSLSITLTQIQHFADYELRSMTVTMEKKDDSVVSLKVKHFLFTSWPDHGVPQFTTAFISFIKRVRQSQPKDGKAPLVVHCSAGVGRTGVYITLDTMLDRMEDVDSVSVYDCVTNLRAKRVFMVQTQAQYIFVHDALEELITCGDTSFNVRSMRTKVNQMGKINPETGITGFHKQFQLLEKVSCKLSIYNDCADSQQAVNKPKNRFRTMVPYDATRVVLRTVSALSGSNYINASWIDGYKERNAFIATQCPLDNTIGDFWRMIWDNKSAVIVLLCNPKHKKDFTQFWPDKNEEHGPVKVTQKFNEEKNGYLVYKFTVMGPAHTFYVKPEPLQVTMLHFISWPNEEKPTNNAGLIALIREALEAQHNTGNRAMAVVCSDGCGRSGTFIAIYNTIERLKVEGVVDIFQVIKNSRLNRVDLVSNLKQYESCHEVVLEFLDEFETFLK